MRREIATRFVDERPDGPGTKDVGPGVQHSRWIHDVMLQGCDAAGGVMQSQKQSRSAYELPCFTSSCHHPGIVVMGERMEHAIVCRRAGMPCFRALIACPLAASSKAAKSLS